MTGVKHDSHTENTERIWMESSGMSQDHLVNKQLMGLGGGGRGGGGSSRVELLRRAGQCVKHASNQSVCLRSSSS